MDASQDKLVSFVEESERHGGERDGSVPGVWHILIVDDEEEVHKATKLVLSSLEFEGRRLQFHHAYSGSEAIECIKKNHDIALMLLDVIMETDDAGLKVVDSIRNELHNDVIRIILNTGQPGHEYGPEANLIKKYDINDYKLKIELTRTKLITTTIAAIRSYQQICTIKQNQLSLQKVVNVATLLLKTQTIQEYCSEVISQLADFFQLDMRGGVACSKVYEDGSSSLDWQVLAALGDLKHYSGLSLGAIVDQDWRQAIQAGIECGEHSITPSGVTLFIQSETYKLVIFLANNKPISDLKQPFLNILLHNISLGFKNVILIKKLHFSAYFDSLTHLPNRRSFVIELDRVLQRNRADTVSVLIDIKHFSDINEGLDQEVGNALLKAVADRLVSAIDLNRVTITSVEADVFGLHGPVNLLTPERLDVLFAQPFKALDYLLQVDVVMGFCPQSSADGTGLEWLKNTNIALNKAKKNTIQNYNRYNAAMGEESSQRMAMLRRLREDFKRGKLQLWYQPQFSLHNHQLVGAEALLRWELEEGDYVLPEKFVALAEYSGLIIDVGNWVMNEACQFIAQLQELGRNNVRIAVNISVLQFRNPRFVDSVIQGVQTYQIKPEMLELEITESMLMEDPHTVISHLEMLHKFGVQLALDDFGTGFSSLVYLQQLPLNRIKVDRSFIENIDHAQSIALAETIIQLGKRLNLKSIAEGIETESQERYLKQVGCDEVQGFRYAKPMPKKDFLSMLAKPTSF